MAFEDAAKRMKAQRGGTGDAPTGIDPDQIIAEAVAADRRAQRLRDLILGTLLLAGGLLIGLLWYSTVKQKVARFHDGAESMTMDNLKLSIIATVFAGGAILAGLHKLLRGVGILRRKADRDD